MPIFTLGRLPGPGLVNCLDGEPEQKIEVYDRGRVAYVTGHALEPERPLAERQRLVTLLAQHVRPARTAALEASGGGRDDTPIPAGQCNDTLFRIARGFVLHGLRVGPENVITSTAEDGLAEPLLEEVWAGADKAMANAGAVSAGLYSGKLKVVDRDQARGVIRSEEENSFGATRAYVGIFISPAAPGAASYVVEVSKILRARTEVIQGRAWEVDLLRAIQADVGGK